MNRQSKTVKQHNGRVCKIGQMTFLMLVIFLVAFLSGCGDDGLEAVLAYRQSGIESMEAGDYESAIIAFDAALAQRIGKITQTELDICYYKAEACYALGDYDAALEIYDAILSYKKGNANAHYLRGCLMLRMGEMQRAQQDFADAVKYKKNDYELYINIYENLEAHDLTAEGEAYLAAALAIKGDKEKNAAFRGEIYYLLGRYDEAKSELLTAIDSGNTEANLLMARSCEALGDITSAENYYLAYVASGHADSVTMNTLAEIAMSNGDYSTALDYVHQGLKMEEVPNQQQLMRNEIIASEHVGDFENAWVVIQEYVVLYPDDEEAQREYIFLQNRQGVKE